MQITLEEFEWAINQAFLTGRDWARETGPRLSEVDEKRDMQNRLLRQIAEQREIDD